MAQDTSINEPVCLITGATSGLGRAAALKLAAAGADLVIVGRDRRRGEQVVAEIKAANPRANHTLLLCDLSSQAQVRRLAATVLARRERLDVLVNNAALDLGNRQLTEDGIELTFAVNHLAPFLLTALAIPALNRSRAGRVINVSSGAHHQGKLDFEDLQGERRFHGQRAYNQSKLAGVLFTLELARRAGGTNLTVNCADPGWVKGTNLGRNASLGLKAMAIAMWPAMVTPAQGADTIVWAATAPELAGQSGLYFKRRKAIQPSDRARDPALARRLWEVSESLCKVTFNPRDS